MIDCSSFIIGAHSKKKQSKRKRSKFYNVFGRSKKKILFLQSSLSYLWGEEYVIGFGVELGKRH